MEQHPSGGAADLSRHLTEIDALLARSESQRKELEAELYRLDYEEAAGVANTPQQSRSARHSSPQPEREPTECGRILRVYVSTDLAVGDMWYYGFRHNLQMSTFLGVVVAAVTEVDSKTADGLAVGDEIFAVGNVRLRGKVVLEAMLNSAREESLSRGENTVSLLVLRYDRTSFAALRDPLPSPGQTQQIPTGGVQRAILRAPPRVSGSGFSQGMPRGVALPHNTTVPARLAQQTSAAPAVSHVPQVAAPAQPRYQQTSAASFPGDQSGVSHGAPQAPVGSQRTQPAPVALTSQAPAVSAVLTLPGRPSFQAMNMMLIPVEQFQAHLQCPSSTTQNVPAVFGLHQVPSTGQPPNHSHRYPASQNPAMLSDAAVAGLPTQVPGLHWTQTTQLRPVNGLGLVGQAQSSPVTMTSSHAPQTQYASMRPQLMGQQSLQQVQLPSSSAAPHVQRSPSPHDLGQQNQGQLGGFRFH